MKCRDQICSRHPGRLHGYARKATLEALTLPAESSSGAPPKSKASRSSAGTSIAGPASRGVVIVTGTADFDKAWDERLRSATAKVAPNLPVRVLSDLPIEDVERELAALTPDSVVLGGPFQARREGPLFRRARRSSWSAWVPWSRAPMFHMSWLTPSAAERLASQPFRQQAGSPRQAAAIAKSILGGTPPAAVALPGALSQQRYVDWRQLRRWKIERRSGSARCSRALSRGVLLGPIPISRARRRGLVPDPDSPYRRSSGRGPQASRTSRSGNACQRRGARSPRGWPCCRCDVRLDSA